MLIVFESRVFSVEFGRVRFPNGSQHETAVVRHRPSVVLIPMQDDGRVVLVRQYRPSINRVLWELPAGSLEAGETADAAAIRECEEEIGLVPYQVERLAAFFPAPGFCDEQLIFYRVSDLRPPEPSARRLPDEDEDIQAQALTVEDAKAMVIRGDVVDLKTAYGLTLI